MRSMAPVGDALRSVRLDCGYETAPKCLPSVDEEWELQSLLEVAIVGAGKGLDVCWSEFL